MPVRDSNSVAAGTGSGPTLLALPGTVQDGDRGVLAILQGGSQAITVNTAGWSATTGAQGTSSTTLRLTLYEKILTAAEAGTNVSVSFAASQQHVLAVVVQYGVTGQDGSPVVVTDTTADALADLAGVTPSGDGREILAFAASRASVSNTAFSLAIPANYAELFETVNVGAVNRNGLAVFHRVLVGGSGVAETPGGGSVAVTGSTVTSVGITIALTPAAAAAPPQPQSRRGPARARRRGSFAQPVPVQVVIAPSPPPPPANIPRARSWWRPKPRYGRAEPPWRPLVIAPSPTPPVTAVPRARRWPLPRRKAQARQPVPPPPAPQVTVWVPAAIPARRRPLPGRRARAAQPVPRVVVHVPLPAARRRPLLLRRRGRAAQPVPVATQVVIVPAVPPPAVGQRKRRWWPLGRRGSTAVPLPQAAAAAPVAVDLLVDVHGLSVRTFTGPADRHAGVAGAGVRAFAGPASSRTTVGRLSTRDAADGVTL